MTAAQNHGMIFDEGTRLSNGCWRLEPAEKVHQPARNNSLGMWFTVQSSARLGVMKPRTDMVSECNRRAVDARRIAETTDDPAAKSAFLELARRWLALARDHQRARHTAGPRNTLVRPAEE
jgi:hypothetical protein